MTRKSRLLLSAAALVLAAVAGHAAPATGRAVARTAAPDDYFDAGNTAYDGRFVFVRLRYEMGLRGGRFFRGDLPWAHDYPRAERNLSKILGEVTSLKPFLGPNGGNVLMLDDPELHKFPFAYMSEPGYWTLNDDEARGLRTWLQKGGFLLFDDFRGDHWVQFRAAAAARAARRGARRARRLASGVPLVLRHRDARDV